MSNPETPGPAVNLSRRALLRRAALAAGGAGLALAPPAVGAPAKPAHPSAPTPAGPATPPADEVKNIDDVVKGFDKIDGVLTLYRKKNDLYAEIKPGQLDKQFLLQATRETGTSGPGGVAGDPLADIVFRLQKANDQIYLVEPNITFRADPKSPEAVSLKRSFAEGYLAAFKIEAIRPAPKEAKDIAAIKDAKAKQDALEKAAVGYLIHIPTLFLADIPNFMQDMRGYAIDAEKTYLKSVKNFPANLIVSTQYVLTGRPTGFFGGDTLADSRGFAEEVAYNLFPLTDTGYKPRFYDERIGYFTEDYQTFDEDVLPDNARRMILRWHLVKKDPKAAISEPVTPITFWVDNATPTRYRDAIREGILYWNAAFEPLGFKDAVRCEIMPDNADWDPGDMSHNVVRWTSSPGAGYAVAQFRHNPLTGEIINAAITVDASMARFTNLSYPTTMLNGQPGPSPFLPGTPAAGGDGRPLTPPEVAAQIIHARPDPSPRNRCRCDMAQGAMQAAAFGWDCLTLSADAGGAAGAPPPTLAEFTHQYLRSVVSHEMGHCLGLRHNFKASAMLTQAQLQDKAMTSRYGVTGSVMDYLPANVPPVGGRRADVWTPCIGPYDKWAIEYGYTDFGGDPFRERVGLAAIAGRSREFGHAFASDEDADALDPLITRFDLGADPLAYRIAMTERAHALLGSLEYRYPASGQSYYELTRLFVRVLNQYAGHSVAVSRFVGGILTNRNHAGDKDAVLPVQAVPFADQRRALQALVRYALSDRALQFSPSLLAKLEQNPAPFSDRLPFGFEGQQDMSVLDFISFAQSTGLYTILNHDTLGRIETNEFRAGPSGRPLSVLETMQTITDAVWTELDGRPHVLRPLRRRLQRTHVDALIDLARPSSDMAMFFGPPPNDDAGTFARSLLRGLAPKLAAAEKATRDPSTAAHFEETRARIVRFLHAQTVV
ncbi:MAG: zinc-dependent metalloprotease [Armatimonadetes bacterium]|nr:zinc-dependent metalloprotease [Armatimonadota bacterium]